MPQTVLSPTEARVLAALVEKSHTTPQYYPMSTHALMLAANQKTCRNPVMNLTEGETGAALNRLESEQLVARDDLSGRVTKWRHQFQHQFLLQPGPLAVLVTLMLRGPQTLSELRANAAGIGGPADAPGIEAALRDLSDRAQPLVTLLPRAPGQKEARYAHLVCGAPPASAPAPTAPRGSAAAASVPSANPDLEQRVRALEQRVAQLEQQLAANTADSGAAST